MAAVRFKGTAAAGRRNALEGNDLALCCLVVAQRRARHTTEERVRVPALVQKPAWRTRSRLLF